MYINQTSHVMQPVSILVTCLTLCLVLLLASCQSGSSHSVLLPPENITQPLLTVGKFNGELTASWKPVTRADTYTLRYSSVQGESAKGTIIKNITTNSVFLTDLTGNTTYYFSLVAHNEGGSAKSSEVVFLLPLQPFTISSNTFTPGETLPIIMSSSNANQSPHLRWENPPQGVASFAIVMYDEDSPSFKHWVLANIPATQTEVAQGASTIGTSYQYIGPFPPPKTTHKYHFEVYALDQENIDLTTTVTTFPINRERFFNELNSRGAGILDVSRISGTYE